MANPFPLHSTTTSDTADNDQTLSPYFVVKGDSSAAENFPLKSTSAEVDIAGVIADVTVKQVYGNNGDTPIEAIYVFPASTRAAVYAMKMKIGNRVIHAEIDEKKQARKRYEEAKEAGKSASLLEQQRSNVFRMNVANIMPGDTIQVTLNYTELLVPEDGVYKFVYPTVVGPRYSKTTKSEAKSRDKFLESPYTKAGEEPSYDFDMNVTVSAGMPIQSISSETHKINVEYPETSRARVTLPPSQAKSGNRDFVLTYQLAGKKIQSGLLLYEGKEENFFLLMGQPPNQVEPEQIPPREYIFVMDVSGSMRGFPLDTSKKLIRNLLVNLRPQDRFNILFFAGGSGVLSEHPLQATPENIEKAIHYVENQRGGGGTEILPALNRALNMPPVKNSSRIVVISTDGMVGVERETFELIRNNLGQANFFPFGIGSSVNRFIIEGMARAGMGEPQVVKSKSEAARKAERFRDYINSPVLTDVKINFGSFNAYAVEPPSVPDLFAEKPIIAFGKWKGPLEGTITLSGRTPQGSYQRRLDVTKFRPDYANKALKYLWARHRIKLLSDYHEISGSDQLKNKVTKLGLKYNLLTPFTSFVAIDQRIRRDGDTVETVKQPLPMPEGMPNTAIGRRATAFSASLGQKTVMARNPSSDQSQGTVAQSSLTSPDITVLTGALTARELRPLFSEKAQTLQSCFASASGPLTLETVVQLTASGDLKLVSISSSNGSQSLVDCVKQFLRDRSVPEELQNKTGRFRATFSRK